MAEQTDAQRLTDVSETIIGSVKNGPWVLIADPNLRKVVGEYVADACHTIALDAGLDAGLDEAMERAHDATPQRLDTVSKLIAPDARERLARHLWAADGDGQRNPDYWDQRACDHLRDTYRARADAALAAINGQEN